MTSNKKYFGIVCISALLMAGSIGLNINSLGVFILPVSTDLEILVGEFSIHSTLISIGIALASFVIPTVVNRFNFKVVIGVATALVALSTFGMSLSTAVWQFSVLGFVRGFASAFFGIVPVQLLINHWFVSKHGLVTSIVFSFSGIAGAMFSPILSNVIINQGWQTAYVVQAVLFVLLSLPALLFPFKFNPEDEGSVPYVAESSTEKDTTSESVVVGRTQLDKVFYVIMLTSILITALTGFAQHLSSVGEDVGFSASIGALMISACMIGNIAFKLLIGIVSDARGPSTSIALMTTIALLGFIFIFLGHNEMMMILGSFLFGAVYSITAVGLALLTKQIYSPQTFIKGYPLVNFVANIGAAFAVSLYGFSYDFSSSYNSAIIISMIICLVVILSVVYIQRDQAKVVVKN